MLHLSYVAARSRATGALEFIEHACSVAAGHAAADVAAVYNMFVGQTTEAAELRREYSHIVYVVDNVIRAHHEFPDESALIAKQRSAAITEAQRDLDAATAAEKQHAASVQKLDDARKAKAAAQARLTKLTAPPETATGKPVGAHLL